jgi:hypothetical protein
MGYYEVGFDSGFNTSQIWNFSRCSYAVLMEAAEFNWEGIVKRNWEGRPRHCLQNQL